MAWAATTGGCWFLFEKAELGLSKDGRLRIAGWIHEGFVWHKKF
jgi:hypothetical protein